MKEETQLILEKGVWKRLLVRVNQKLDYDERKKHSVLAKPPIWEKIIVLANQKVEEEKTEIPIEKPKEFTLRNKRTDDLDMLSTYDQMKIKPKKALFHDPALFFRDENKDRSKPLEIVSEVLKETGQVKQSVLEFNPLTD